MINDNNNNIRIRENLSILLMFSRDCTSITYMKYVIEWDVIAKVIELINNLKYSTDFNIMIKKEIIKKIIICFLFCHAIYII